MDKTFNQSDRIENYSLKIEKLKKDGRLYPCFETAEELSLKKKSLLSSGKPPIYDRLSLSLTNKEIDEKIKFGQRPHWRFQLDEKIIEWNDLIKGVVKFDSKNLSDPILIREDGSLLYHLPSVIDDIEEEISHIVRGEDHISNTAFHMQIFEALEARSPNFAHHPFLTDQQGKGFGKILVKKGLEIAETTNETICFVSGNYNYYKEFDFFKLSSKNLIIHTLGDLTYGELLVKELKIDCINLFGQTQ